MTEAILMNAPGGLSLQLLPWGARLQRLWVPARRGRIDAVVGYGTPVAYRQDPYFLGAAIGRLSGRVGGARFPTAQGVCALQPNEGRNQLHGGANGFHARSWQLRERQDGPRPRLLLATESPDGEGGYPGRVRAEAEFALQDLTLELELRAWCDRPTPVAMTYHPYFNLSGIDHGTIDDHLLQVEGDEILALDAELIPTGARIPVAATPFDFRAPAPLGQHLRSTDPQLAIAGGIDHTWLLRRDRRFDAVLRHPGSGVTLRVESNQPSLQVYTGQALSDAGGRGFVPRQALCLEPQNPPDAVNHADFPSPWLQPGERYVNRIRYVFSVDG